jgi:hypothetical protein
MAEGVRIDAPQPTAEDPADLFVFTRQEIAREINDRRRPTSHGGAEVTTDEYSAIAKAAHNAFDQESPLLAGLNPSTRSTTFETVWARAAEANKLSQPTEPKGPSLANEADLIAEGVRHGDAAFEDPVNISAMQWLIDTAPNWARAAAHGAVAGEASMSSKDARDSMPRCIEAFERLATELDKYPSNGRAQVWKLQIAKALQPMRLSLQPGIEVLMQRQY